MAKIISIAWVTFQDIIRDKILYNVFLVASGLLGATWVTSKLMGSRPTRLVLDVGLSSIQLATLALAMLIGASIVGKEFDRRTVHMALSRPLKRGTFVVGKYFGLVWAVTINWLLLCIACGLILSQVDDGLYMPQSYLTLCMGMVLSLVQACMIGAFALMFSTLSTFSVSLIFSIGFALVGSNISYFSLLAERMKGGVLGFLFKIFALVFPNFEYFHLGTQVTYSLPVSWSYFFFSVVYGCIWVAIALLVSSFTVDRKEV